MTNGIESSTQFANLFAQIVTTCGTISDAANVLMSADPVTEIERVHVLVERMRVLTACACRIEAQDVAGDSFWNVAYTADEAAALASPLA
jgi:hypothetical protein